MKLKILVVVGVSSLLLIGCASQRTRATCAEIEYRLNSMSYSPDQRVFLEDELAQCRAEQAEQEKDDVITNKISGSIRDRFVADSIAKANETVETTPAEQSSASEVPAETATEASAMEEQVETATEESAGN